MSRLIEIDVDNLDGQHLGRLIDAVIDTRAQKVQYAVLALDRAIGAATEHAFAVPLHALQLSSNGDRSVLEIPHARLMGLVGSDPPPSKTLETLRYLGTVDRTYELLAPNPPVGSTR